MWQLQRNGWPPFQCSYPCIKPISAHEPRGFHIQGNPELWTGRGLGVHLEQIPRFREAKMEISFGSPWILKIQHSFDGYFKAYVLAWWVWFPGAYTDLNCFMRFRAPAISWSEAKSLSAAILDFWNVSVIEESQPETIQRDFLGWTHL